MGERRLYVLACGSRTYDDIHQLRAVFDRIDPLCADIRLVHGDAPGADRLAATEAALRTWTVHSMPAQWARYQKDAGRRRNEKMAQLLKNRRELGYDALVLAFRNGDTPGTWDMIDRARRYGLEVQVIDQRSSADQEPLFGS